MSAINQSLKNWVGIEILINTLVIVLVAIIFWKSAVGNDMIVHFAIGGIGIILIPRLVFLIGLWQDLNAQITRKSEEVAPGQ